MVKLSNHKKPPRWVQPSGGVSNHIRMVTVFDFTTQGEDVDFDWFSALLETADNTPPPEVTPLTEEQKERTKILNRLHAHRYRARHANKIRIRNSLRYNAATEGDATAADVRLQYKSQKGKCWWCGSKIKKEYHVDHRVPLTKGGSNGAGNIVISCNTCNLRKNNKMPHEFNGRLL